jgi:FAD/FMN-containing dehydrogenase
MDERPIVELRGALRGALLQPGDGEYDTARRVWNAAIDRRPALIARCAGLADVRQALQFSREHDLPVAVRGGGHSVAGYGTCDGGMVIDLSPMKGVQVDPSRRTALAQAGLTWGELDHETAAFGLATTGGHVSTTGIAGLTLGGGIGWLMRQHGLTCDNLLAAYLLTAGGELVTASPTENADLFWGLRGGGGNFGVVTAFEYRLHPVETVLGGMLLYPVARAAEVLRYYREFVATAPDELSTVAAFLTGPPLPFLPTELQGAPLLAIAACFAGPIAAGEATLQPLRAFGPPGADLIGPMPYVAMQRMLDDAFPPGRLNYWKSGYLDQLEDAAIDRLCAQCTRLPSPFSAVTLIHLGGAVSRVDAEETAVRYRKAAFALGLYSAWADPALSDGQIEWTRSAWAALEPITNGGVFVSFLGDEGAARVRAAYGPATYDRLVALKRRYDSKNVFRLNQNIPPH